MTKEEWYRRGVDPAKKLARRERERRHKLEKTCLSRGITLDEHDQMFREQGGLCAICEQPPVGKTRLSLDHCHGTGKFRGLLCDLCNVGLARFRDDLEIMQAAMDYLKASRI